MAREAGGRMWAIAILFLAGATIGLISLALPHSSRANTGALLVNIGAAYGGGAAAWFLRRRLPPWFAHVFAGAGTLVVTRAIYYSGESTSYYAIWYAWVALYAFYFFTRPRAVLHLVLIGAAYAAVLAHGPGHAATARWLTTIFTLVIAAVFIDTLVRQLRRHAHAAHESARRLEATATAIDGMAACTGIERLYELLATSAATVTQADRALVWEVPEGDEPPRLLSAAGPELTRSELDREAETVRSRDEGTARRWKELTASDGRTRWLAVLFETSDPLHPAEFERLVHVLAGAFTGASSRLALMTRLEEAARTDELCGLPNRRAWEEELPLQLARARRFSYPLCVALLDLDGLKLLNDSLGHQAGDTALREASAAWAAELRDVDTLVRWGGDEFALIFPGCALADAARVADRIRAATPGRVTCSGGVAEWDGHETAAELVARADQALYDAKESGRDRLVAHFAPAGGQPRGSSTTTGSSRVAIDR